MCICVFKDSDDDFVEIMMFGAWARALPPKTLESAPMRSQTSPSARALTKTHIPPNHSDRDHVKDDNDHHQW